MGKLTAKKMSACEIIRTRGSVNVRYGSMTIAAKAVYRLLAHIAALEADLAKAEADKQIAVGMRYSESDRANRAEARLQIAVEALVAIEEWMDEWSVSISDMALREFPGFPTLSRIEEP